MQRDHLDLNEVPHFMLSLFILLLLCDFLMEKLSRETFRREGGTSTFIAAANLL